MPKTLRAALAALLLFAPCAAAADLEKPMADVERLRGLPFLHGVAQRAIERSELRTVLRREIAKSLPYSPDDYVKVLQSLQLVDRSSPALLEKMLDLYEAQVLAFYDPVSHTYFAIRGTAPALKGMAGADALEDSVVVHELTHAMQDQRFGASKRDRELQLDVDAQLAYHALLEGEATFVMMDWLLERAGQSIDEIVKNDAVLGLMTSAAAAEKTIDPGTPPYLIESLKFPYMEGLKLVVDAYRRGGWKEVDRMHANPPASTREVIHAKEYFARLDAGVPAQSNFDPQPAAPDTLTVEHLGEFHWRFLVGDAEGWLNDRVTVRCDGIVDVDTWWDNAERAASFRDAYVRFLRDRGIEPRATTNGAFVNVVYLAP